MNDLVHLISAACLTGFFGDLLLQIGCKRLHLGGPTGWGLKPYFEQHGAGESLFIATGMMTLFYVIYFYAGYLFFLPFSYTYLAIYGVILDLIFRKFMVFSSLKGYYQYFNYFWSAFWMGVPMMMPLAIFQFFNMVARCL